MKGLGGKEETGIDIVLHQAGILHQGDIVKVRGSVDEYRLRIGKARVEYTVNDNEINIKNIFIKKRKSDYR